MFKKINTNSFFTHYLPSVFFIAVFTVAVFQSDLLIGSLIAGTVALLLLINLFLQSKIVSQVLGIIFLFASAYFLLALFDDIADGESTFLGGYWVGLIFFLSSLIMSVLLIVSHQKIRQRFLLYHK